MTRKSATGDQPDGRKRLLEAAVKLFSRDGFDGTSIRDVTDEAGVSSGLARFHFGSKEGLRDAAEEYALSGYLQMIRDANRVGSTEELDALIESQAEELGKVAGFLRRTIMDERPVALDFLRNLLTTTEALKTEERKEYPDEPALWDPVQAVVQRLGYLLLAPQIKTLLKQDLFSIEALKQRNHQNGRLSELARLGLAVERKKR